MKEIRNLIRFVNCLITCVCCRFISKTKYSRESRERARRTRWTDDVGGGCWHKQEYEFTLKLFQLRPFYPVAFASFLFRVPFHLCFAIHMLLHWMLFCLYVSWAGISNVQIKLYVQCFEHINGEESCSSWSVSIGSLTHMVNYGNWIIQVVI